MKRAVVSSSLSAALAAFVVVACLALTGCPSAGKRDARLEARSKRGDSGVDAGLTLLDPASGTPVLLTGDRLPDTFPRMVPLYPGAKILGALVTSETGKRTHVVTLLTPDATPQADEFYRTHLRGFVPVREQSSGDSVERILDAVDASLPLRVTVTSSRSGLGTTVQIVTVEG